MDGKVRDILRRVKSPEEAKELLEAYHVLAEEDINFDTSKEGALDEALGTDLLVMCAEASVKAQEYEVGKDCIRRYFALNPATSQFLCRAHFVQAEIEYEKPRECATIDAQSEKDKKLFALENILKGVKVAQENSKRYGFLIVNASILYWKIARSFMERGLRESLIPTLSNMCIAMEEIDMQDMDMRCSYLLELARAYKESKQFDKVQNTLVKANALAKIDQGEHRPEIIKLFSCLGETTTPLDLKDVPQLEVFGKIEFLKKAAETGTCDLLSELEYAKNLLISKGKIEVAAESTAPATENSLDVSTPKLETVRSTKSGRAPSPSKPKLPSEVGPVIMKTLKVVGLPEDMNNKALFSLARIALQKGYFEYVSQIMEALRNSDMAWVKITCEYLACELNLAQIPDKYIHSKKAIEFRKVQLLKITTAIKYAAYDKLHQLVQTGCVILWNGSLPLLQPNLRCMIKEPFKVAAQALETSESTLSHLLCPIHIELGKCEEDDGMFTKAKTHIYKAIELDLTGQHTQFLQTRKRRLDILTAIYDEWEEDFEKALILTEQAKESTDYCFCRIMLIRGLCHIAPNGWKFDDTIDKLNDFEKESGSDEDPYGLKYMTKHSRNKFLRFEYLKDNVLHRDERESLQDRERALLFAKIAKIARKYEIWDVASPAAHFFLEYVWDIDAKAERRLAAEVNFIRGECFIQMLKRHGIKLGHDAPGIAFPVELIKEKEYYDKIKNSSKNEDTNDLKGDKDKSESPTLSEEVVNNLVPPREFTAEEEYSLWIRSLSEEAIESFLQGLSIGLSINENWIVLNAAVYSWNYCLHLCNEKKFFKLLRSFNIIFEGMKTAGLTYLDVFCAISNALSFANMQTAQMIKEYDEESVEQRVESPDPALKKDKKADKETKGPTTVKKGDKKAEKKVDEKKGEKKVDKKPVKGKETNSSLNLGSESAESILSRAMEVCLFAINSTQPKQKRSLVTTLISLMHTTSTSYSSLDTNIVKETRAMIFIEAMDYAFKNNIESPGLMSVSQICDLLGKCTDVDSPLLIELWIKLGVQALNQEEYDKALEYCAKGLEMYEAVGTKLKKKHITSKQLEVIHTGYKTMGRSKMNLSSASELEKDQVEQLRKESLDYFWKSAKYAYKAQNYELLNKVSFHIWNAILPLIRDPSSRALLLRPLEKLTNYLAILGGDTLIRKNAALTAEHQDIEQQSADSTSLEQSEPQAAINPRLQSIVAGETELRVRLYQVLFECYNDQKKYKDGIGTVESAFSVIPKLYQKSLWQKKILFKCMLGKKIEGDMGNLKDHPEATKAEVWRTVAHSSNDQMIQLKAFQRCILSITSNEGKSDQVEYLIEFGEWLYRNGFPLQDSIDQLEKAVDILMDIENFGEDSDQSLTVSNSSIRTVQQLELLARVYVMLASVSSEEMSTYCLIAHHYYMKIFELSFMEAACAFKYGINVRPKENDNDGAVDADKSKDKKGGKSGNSAKKDTKNTKTDKKGEKSDSAGEKGDSKSSQGKKGSGIAGMPVNYAEWANFEFSDDIKGAFNTPQKYFDSVLGLERVDAKYGSKCCKFTINKDTISKPDLSLYYLRRLLLLLEQNYLDHLCIPVLCFMQYIADEITKDEVFSLFCHWKFVNICQRLNLSSAVSFHFNQAGATRLSEKTRDICRAKVRLQMHQNQLILKDAKTPDPYANDEETNAFVKGLAKFGRVPSSVPGMKNQVEKSDTFLQPMSERECFLQQAFILIEQGHYEYAQELLYESQIMANAFKDSEIMGGILFALSKLAFLNNDSSEAIKLIEASRTFQGDITYWKDCTLDFCNYLIADGQRIGECKDLLGATISGFTMLIAERPNFAPEYFYVLGFLHAKYANILVDEMHILKANDSPWQATHSSAISRFEQSLSAFERSSSGIMEKSNVTVDYINTLLLSQKSSFEEQQELLVDIVQIIIAQTNELQDFLLKVMPNVLTGGISLPIQRSLAKLYLFLAELELDVYSDNYDRIDPYGIVLESRQNTESEQSLASYKKQITSRTEMIKYKIAQYAAGTPEPDPIVTHWNDIKQDSSVHILNHLSSALANAENDNVLKAKIHLAIGRLYIFMSSTENMVSYWPSRSQLQAAVKAEQPDNTAAPADSPALSASHRAAATSAKSRQKQGEATGNDASPEIAGEQAEDELDSDESPQSNAVSSVFLNIGPDSTIEKPMKQQAILNLEVAVNILINEQREDIFASACEVLMNCFGSLDPISTQKYIIMYQSALSILHLKKTSEDAFKFVKGSGERSLMEQQNRLRTIHCNPSQNCPTVEQNIQALKQKSTALHRTLMQPSVPEILRDLPTGLRCVVLQHSRDFKYLYATVCHRPDEAAIISSGSISQVQSAKSIQPPSANAPLVVKTKVDKSELEVLCRDFLRLKLEIQKHVVKKQEDLSIAKREQEASKLLNEKMEDASGALGNLPNVQEDDEKKGDKSQKDDTKGKREKSSKKDDKKALKEAPAKGGKKGVQATSTEEEINQEEEEEKRKNALLDPDRIDPVLAFQFKHLVQRIESYLQPVIVELCHFLGVPKSVVAVGGTFEELVQTYLSDVQNSIFKTDEDNEQQTENKDAKQNNTCNNESSPYSLIILADSTLMTLPLEAISVFRMANVRSVSRDFNLHFTNQRLLSVANMNSVATNTDDKDKKGQKKDKPPQKASNKDGSTDSGIDPCSWTYVVDPSNDSISMKEFVNEQCDVVFNSLHSEHTSISKWEGLSGSSHLPSPSEWQKILTSGNSFFFYGVGKLLAHIHPQYIAGIDMSACQAMVIFDQLETNDSFRKQLAKDLEKPMTVLQLEQSFESARLFSLRGVNSLVMNQWASSFSDNAEKVNKMANLLFDETKSIGQYLLELRNAEPHSTPVLIKRVADEHGVSFEKICERIVVKVKDDEQKGDASSAKGNAGVDEGNSITENNDSEPSKQNEPEKVVASLLETTGLNYLKYNTVNYGLPHLKMK
eukprot:Nk52_evm60s745 gene=Nk52_evmTU60s745